MDIRSIFSRVVRCDAPTAIANAFRRAFGLPQIGDAPRGALVVSDERYEGIAECFANRESPMDWRT